MKYIAYYRVSTQEQGDSGLGLKAQERACKSFLKESDILISSFTDIASGAIPLAQREGLRTAVEWCKIHKAILIVKEVSRISRSGYSIMAQLNKAGVDYIEVDSPHDPEMVKGIKFVIAKDEKEKISERTTSALAEIKAKLAEGIEHISKAGKLVEALGSPQNLTNESRERSIEARRIIANENPNNVKAGALVVALRDLGNLSFYAITNKLNELAFKTSRENKFSEVATKRLYERYSS